MVVQKAPDWFVRASEAVSRAVRGQGADSAQDHAEPLRNGGGQQDGQQDGQTGPAAGRTAERTAARTPSSPASSPDTSTALTIARIGARARITNAAEKTEWSPADFATEFLGWVAATYPATAGGWISSVDIASSFFPRFAAATGRYHLRLGTLRRGLTAVAKPMSYKYLDASGRRRNGTLYKVPRAEPDVAAGGRSRAWA